jgi:hypothetical protein
VIALDRARKRATLLHAYTHTPRVRAHIFGSVQTQSNGDVLVGWGGSRYFTEYAADGRVRFDAGLPEGGESYRTLRFPWHGRPHEPPALAARSGQLYASWNGTTETAAWQVHAGPSAGRLVEVATVPRNGFETAITPPGNAAYAAVTALDAGRRPLASSAAIRL